MTFPSYHTSIVPGDQPAAHPFPVVAADLLGSGDRWLQGGWGAGTLAEMPSWHECAPMHTLGIINPGQACGFRLCFCPQCSWSCLHPSRRDGLAPNRLREQLAKVTPSVCTFELFIPSWVLAIRYYLFGGAYSDVEQGKCLSCAVNQSFLVHLPGTPTPSNCQGWAQRLPSRDFHSPSAGRAGWWEPFPRWGCVTCASAEALIIAPYLSLQTFCALMGHVCVTAEHCRCWSGCGYGLCFAW